MEIIFAFIAAIALCLPDDLHAVHIRHFPVDQTDIKRPLQQSALTYMVYARHTPVACIANCPVCDLPFHYTERDDLPRTLYSAFYHEKGSINEVLLSASPIHLIEKMPEADYIIFHCEKDLAVNKENHSDLFVAGMREQGHRVIYHTVPERGHCDLSENMWALYNDYAVNAVLSRC